MPTVFKTKDLMASPDEPEVFKTADLQSPQVFKTADLQQAPAISYEEVAGQALYPSTFTPAQRAGLTPRRQATLDEHTAIVREARLNPPPAPVSRPGLLERTGKQFANRLILEDIERNRPSSTLARGLPKLERGMANVDKALGKDPKWYDVLNPVKFGKAWWGMTKGYYSKDTGEESDWSALADPEARAQAGLVPSMQFNVPPAETTAEKVVDVATGGAAFLTRLAITRKLIPASLKGSTLGEMLAWEMENTQGPTGQGALMAITFKSLGGIEGPVKQWAARSATLGGLTAVSGGDWEDIAIAATIPSWFVAVGKVGAHLGARAKYKASLKVLGLKRGASEKATNDAFRKYLKKYHSTGIASAETIDKGIAARDAAKKGPPSLLRDMWATIDGVKSGKAKGRGADTTDTPLAIRRSKVAPRSTVTETPIPAALAQRRKLQTARAAQITEPVETAPVEAPAPVAKQTRLAPLQRDIIDYHEKHIGPIDAESTMAAGAVEGGEQYGTDDFPRSFSGKIPTELQEALGGRKNLLMGLKGNQPGGLGEDVLKTLGTDEYVRRLEAVLGGKKGDISRAIDAAEQQAKMAQDAEMLIKIRQYRSLQVSNEGIETIPVNSLQEGDSFEAAGEKFTVIDDKGDLIEVEDDIRGIIAKDAMLPIDKGSMTTTLAQPTLAPTTPDVRQTSKLRQQIGAAAAVKGLTKKRLTELKKKYTGFNRISTDRAKKVITADQLTSLLKAVHKTRPKRIGYKTVITKKTETKIGSLRENLAAKLGMTEAAFTDILKREVGGRVPRYDDAKNFITEEEGKAIIKRMLNTTETVRQTEPFEQAIAKNPEIASAVAKIDSRFGKEKKIRDPRRVESMRYYVQQMQKKSGAPIFAAYQDLVDTHLDGTKTRTAALAQLKVDVPSFKSIARDTKALARVSDYILAQSNLKNKPDLPADITADEIKLAQSIQQIFKDYEIKVRVAKFFNWYHFKQPIAEYDRYKKEIHAAEDIYESQGKDALIEYLKTQAWGVIKSGYEPLETVTQKVRLHNPAPTTVGKSRIKIRTAIEYNPEQRDILKRLGSYMRQMDTLTDLSPKINAYIQLVDDNLSKFKNPGKVRQSTELFLRTLKGYGSDGGFFDELMDRLYSQAATTIIMPNPALALRNLFQNPAFGHDKSILIDPRNKPLTNDDLAYLETRVQQTRQIMEDFLMRGQKAVWGLRTMNRAVDKAKIYPTSDIWNRQWGFWGKINQVRRALKSETTEGMMKAAKFEDMSPLEQRMALSILAKDGPDDMARYVARVYIDDVHFLYERLQRSPAEMGSMGRSVANLLLFPRAYAEKILRATKQVTNGKTHRSRWRGLKRLLAVVVGGYITGAIYQKITGRKRNPYDIFNLLSVTFGGLSWGSVEAVTDITSNILHASMGDRRALAELATAIPRAADMFLPFYSLVIQAIESGTNSKNIDRKLLREIRALIDDEYKVRGSAYQVERTAVEKWQHFLANSDPSLEEQRRRAKVNKPRKIRLKPTQPRKPK